MHSAISSYTTAHVPGHSDSGCRWYLELKTSSDVSNTVHTFTARELDSTGHVVATSGNAILGLDREQYADGHRRQ